MPYAEIAPAPVSPEFFRPVTLPVSRRPQLFVIVDTEEEFDWTAPFSRSSVGVTAMDEVGRLQSVLTRRRRRRSRGWESWRRAASATLARTCIRGSTRRTSRT